MKKTSLALFRILCGVLLIFTTIAPSIAVANSGDSHRISIHAGSEQRHIIDARVVILPKVSTGSGSGSVPGPVHIPPGNGDTENGIYQLTVPVQMIKPAGQYKVALSVKYSESEKNYQFIEERILSGAELLNWTELTIPTSKDLVVTEIKKDSDFNITRISNYFGDNKEWTRASGLITTDDEFIVASEPTIVPVTIEGEVKGKKHYLSGELTVGQPFGYDSLISNSSELVLQGNFDYISLHSNDYVNNFHLYNGEEGLSDEKIQLTNGNYKISFQNDYYWYGEIEVLKDETINLPSQPTEITFEHFNQTNYNDSTDLNYGVSLASGLFKAYQQINPKIDFELYQGTTLIEEWIENKPSGNRRINTSEWKTGEYKLKATLEIDSEKYSTEKEFNFKSSTQALKGTVITAEIANGEPMNSGTVTLYSVKHNYGYSRVEHVVSDDIKLVEGTYEAFIPDTYLLDGIEYLLIVQDYEQKTAYAKKLIGQEQKEIHFDADALKEIKLNVAELTTLDLYSTLVDPQNENFHIPLYLDGNDWNIGSDFPVIVRWNGHDANETGYSWSGLIDINKGEVGDITQATWKTLKPSSKYTNATLSFNDGMANRFKQLNVSYYNHYLEKSLYMEVMDGDTKYSSHLYLPDLQEDNEVSFSSYKGSVNINSTETMAYTSYYDNYGSVINVESPTTTHSFTYELYDGEGKPVGDPITSTNINSFPLPTDLPKGNYTVKLKESTLNSKIVTLELNAPLLIGAEVNRNEGILSLPINIESEYGNVETRWGSYIEIFTTEQYGEYSHGFRLNWNYETNNAFESHYPVTITKDRQYMVKQKLFIPSKNTWIMDEVLLTGEQLLNINTKKPLQVSDNLNLVTLNYSGLGQDMAEKQLHIEKTSEKGMHRFTSMYFESHTAGSNTDAAKVYLLVPDESYSGTFVAKDQNANVHVFDIPSFNSSSKQELFFEKENLAKVTIENEGAALPIFGHGILPNYSQYGNMNTGYTSISHSKGMYDQLDFYVAVNEEFDTPWGYQLKTSNVNLDADKTLNFTGAIKGDITGTSIYQYGNGHHGIGLEYSLTSGDFQVERIFHAVERNYRLFRSLSLVKDPIRDYKGLFNSVNAVPIVYSLKDKQGKVIWEQTRSYRSLSNDWLSLDKELEQGTYSLQVHIPTAPRKSMTLTKEIVITGESMPFVKIDSPRDGLLTNEQNVHVTGTTNKDATVTVELLKEDKKIESHDVISDAEGKFTYTFKPTADGAYSIIVKNEGAEDNVMFVIDRTAPEKATDIIFTKEASGLKVDWKGAKDAVSYKVEVAEGSNPYKALSEQQSGTTAVIPTIKPGATYKVKVVTYDKAGNESVSDVASYEVPVFIATAISIEDKRNADKLLAIDEKLKISLEGSNEEGYTASANVTADGKGEEIKLSFNKETNAYEGTYVIKEGTKKVESISGFIVNGSEKTEEINKELSWSVGSTVKGSVSNGEAVKDATVRLMATKTYTVQTDDQGAYEFKGLPANSYKVTVTHEGKTFTQDDLKVEQAEVKTVEQIVLPAFTDATFKVVDKGTEKTVKDGLSVRLTGPKGIVASGTTLNGKFKTYGGKDVFTKLETGEYTLTVYGQGAYNTTIAKVALVKGTTEYLVEVDKVDVVEKDVTLIFDGKIKNVSSISLYSHSTYAKHQYGGIGNYYEYDVKPDADGKIVIKGVAQASDYELYINVDGYMSLHKTVDLMATQEITVELEQGRVITGTVTDSQDKPVQNADIYAYGGNTYYSTKTDEDGNYELIGLSKKDKIEVYVYSQIYLNFNESIKTGEANAELDIKLSKAAMITGKVVDRNGKALANVSVNAEGKGSYGWTRTATDGKFAVPGLADTKEYSLTFSSYGYPTVTEEGRKGGVDLGEIILQAEGTGNFDGEGNFFAVSKSSVTPKDEVQFTLSYKNNGTVKAVNVPVNLTLPVELTLNPATVALNGKTVKVEAGKVEIPEIAAGATGKITFSATVATNVAVPSLTATASVTEKGTVLTATTSVVFVTLEAPAQTGKASVKVYGNAKHGSTVEVFANNKLVGQTKVDSKWWYADIKLPVTDSAENEEFTLTAKVTDSGSSVFSKPVSVTYEPNVPQVTDVTVHAGWNGDVKLNPYTGVATFAIVEHTPMDTKVVFDKEIDSAKITFLGETYELDKGTDNKTFTFDGSKLGRWTSYGEQLLELTFKKGDVEITMPLMNIIVLIDPSGFVFEGSMENPLKGVQAIVETQDKDKNWVQWDAAKFGQINPQVTDEEGRYGWDVISGLWRVIFTKDGYEPYISRVMDVPPPETELNISMVRTTAPSIITSVLTEKDLTVEFDRLMNVTDKATLIQLFEVGSDTPIAGTVQTVDASGYKSIATPDDKKAGFVEQDSRDEDGFFDTDSSKILSKTFKFVPNKPLKANTTYELVVNGEIMDYGEMQLGNNQIFEFTTAKSDEGSVTPPVNPIPVDPKPITPPVFSDITNVFAKNEINILAAKGIIQGKTETNFAPNAEITRAEFAVLLARSLDLPLKEYEGKFGDVNTSKKWAYAAVEAAARVGIVNGTANGKFNPDAPITREEIAAMVIRAIEYQDKTTLANLDTPANFKDHGSIGAFAIDSVYKANALGVIHGNNGQFNPKNNATRAEAAVMLYRALEKLELLK